ISPMFVISSFFFNDTAPTEIYTLSLHDALPISLAEADGLHLCRAASLHQGLEIGRGADAERLLEAQHVRRIHGGRSRGAIAGPYRGREHAVGQRLPACRGNLPALTAIPRTHVCRRAGGGPAQDHLGQRRQDVRLRAELNLVPSLISSSSILGSASDSLSPLAGRGLG